MSPCRSPATKTLREAGSGPVVTSAGALDWMFIRSRSFVRSPAEKSGMIKAAREEPRASESLRRYKPDQVQRVVARSDISALMGSPSDGCKATPTTALIERVL